MPWGVGMVELGRRAGEKADGLGWVLGSCLGERLNQLSQGRWAQSQALGSSTEEDATVCTSLALEAAHLS